MIFYHKKMTMKYLLTLIAVVAITKCGFAQYSQDAILFSTFQTGSTARIKAIGNASTAIGGDLSSISGNPAGTGFFTKNEYGLTGSFTGFNSGSNYFGTTNSASGNNTNIDNASAVFYEPLNNNNPDKTKGWLSLNFGTSFDRTNNFNQNIYYSGKSNGSSIADYFAQSANKSNYISNGRFNFADNYPEYIAYNQYLIDSVGLNADKSKAVFAPNTSTNPNQSNTISRTGGQSEYAFSVGANYSNKLYLGIGLGFTTLDYNSLGVLNENGYEYVNNKSNYSSSYVTDQTTTGTGFNARFGVIYKPISALRLGLTVTTPTWYNIDDNTFLGLTTQYAGNKPLNDGQNYALNYNLTTPWKLSGGVAVFAGNYGFISADVDYIDYSSTRLSNGSDIYDFSLDNNNIKQYYQSAVNARIGGEARVNNHFFIRGGYGIQGSPQKQIQSSINTTSAGIGYRWDKYYIDITYTHVKESETQYPYILDSGSTFSSPFASLNNTYNNAYLTMGVRF
jgi:hypothetical protein